MVNKIKHIEAKRQNMVEIVKKQGNGIEQVVLPALCLKSADEIYKEYGLEKLIRLDIMIDMFLLGFECKS